PKPPKSKERVAPGRISVATVMVDLPFAGEAALRQQDGRKPHASSLRWWARHGGPRDPRAPVQDGRLGREPPRELEDSLAGLPIVPPPAASRASGTPGSPSIVSIAASRERNRTREAPRPIGTSPPRPPASPPEPRGSSAGRAE